jgi:uracil-DNA glycosylase family 4
MSSEEELKTVAAEVKVCTKCKLYRSAKQGVPGEGPAQAEIMFVGEGPGFHEDQQGRPFVGAAGKFLDELLESIGMKREDVFITNVVKHRPPGNRDPEADELEACSDYLERQIKAINPKVIVTLGRFSMARFFPGAKISAIHGQGKKVNGRLVVAMFHPAAALHQISLRQSILDDFKKLPAIIASAEKAPPTQPDEPETKQLSLF